MARNLSDEFESRTFTGNIFEKIKIANLQAQIISSLEAAISFLVHKELKAMNDKCEKLIQNSNSNYKGQIDNLRKKKSNVKKKLLAKSQQH